MGWDQATAGWARIERSAPPTDPRQTLRRGLRVSSMSGPARRFHGSADCGDDPARGRLCAPWFLSTRILTLIKGPARHRFAVPSRAPLQIRADGWPPRCGQARLSAGLDNDPRLHRGSRNWAESCGSSTHAQRTLAAPWPPGARESRMSAEQCLLSWTFSSSNGCGVEAPLPWALPRERGPDWYNAYLVDLFPDTEPAEHDLRHHSGDCSATGCQSPADFTV